MKRIHAVKPHSLLIRLFVQATEEMVFLWQWIVKGVAGKPRQLTRAEKRQRRKALITKTLKASK